jgi:predicted dehydrogenase
MKTISWGIIGCGDVAEMKSGPAFQKIPNSELLAVMRRNGDKVRDFTKRHKVPIWSTNAEELIQNPDINSIYIATPPSSHLAYTLKALEAGKNVYLEKPMALNTEEAQRICDAVKRSRGKLTVAHYRRKLPAFIKVKELLDTGSLGNILHADLRILQPKNTNIIVHSHEDWRLDPKVSGGGYFYDIGPHQIDLMYLFFGDIDSVSGFSKCQPEKELVETVVNGIIAFKNGVQFRGIWNFDVVKEQKTDSCIIYGTEGSIEFSFYGDKMRWTRNGKERLFNFEHPRHIQQPMIEATVAYFLGAAENPCSAEDGLLVMDTLEKLSGRI